mmetsp:Transcript_49816/g.74043  ORF Transcript_49816/g.74043 Transcript_49816/m.74043 type:complete len:96 (+) Transcript_49816:3-290(+)
MARVLPPTIALPTFSKDAEHTQICSLADFEDETKKSQSTMTHSGNDADDEGCYNGAENAASNESTANEKKKHTEQILMEFMCLMSNNPTNYIMAV